MEDKVIDPRLEARAARDAQAKQNGSVCRILIEDGDVDKILYFRKPHRKLIGLYFKAKELDELEAASNLYKGCVMSELSDMDVLSSERDDLWYTAVMSVETLLDTIVLKKSISLTF